MMTFIDGLDDAGDHMYTYILGQSGGKAMDIPLVLFTNADLSGADTWEEAAALLQENGHYTGITVLRDLAGKDRVVRCQKRT